MHRTFTMYQALAKGTHYLIASSWPMLCNYYHHFIEGKILAHRSSSPRLLLVELAFECELSVTPRACGPQLQRYNFSGKASETLF